MSDAEATNDNDMQQVQNDRHRSTTKASDESVAMDSNGPSMI
jgi:hypothetical protein